MGKRAAAEEQASIPSPVKLRRVLPSTNERRSSAMRNANDLIAERKLAKIDLEIEHLKLQVEAQKLLNRKLQIEVHEIEARYACEHTVDVGPRIYEVIPVEDVADSH